MKQGQLTAIISGAAIVLALASAGLGFAVGAYLPGALAVLSGLLLAVSYVWEHRPRPKTNAALFDKVAQQIEHGRKLVIYERDTGLYAHWYVALRGDEECARAQRYGHPLCMLVIEPRPYTESWAVQGALAGWLSTRTRSTDIVGYLGNGRYVIIMPETSSEQTTVFNERMNVDAPPAEMALAQFPVDGGTFEELYASAATRLLSAARFAA